MSDSGHVYVLAFSDGTVKVGRTQQTGSRLNAHKSDARKFGLTITGQWVSPAHAEWRSNEDALKKIAADLGGTAHSAEYFSGVDFGAVMEKARELPFTLLAADDDMPPARSPSPLKHTLAMTPAPRAVRIAMLEQRACEAEEEAGKARAKAQAAGLAGIFLAAGMTPEQARRMIRRRPEFKPEIHPCLGDAMEESICEEAALIARGTVIR